MQRRGRRVPGVGLVVFVLRSEGAASRPAQQGPRFALTVSRKVGGAVVRNRVKRCLREVLRRVRPHGAPGDVVVMATPKAASMGSRELWEEALGLLGRARIIDAAGATRVTTSWGS